MATAFEELFVPGRVCILGEHSDWAGGFRRFNSDLLPGRTIVCGTNDGLHARVRRHPSALVMRTTTEKGEVVGPCEIPMTPAALLTAAQEGGFFSYAAGVAYKLLTDARIGGIEIDNYKTTLPLKKGLSSSAAVCVLVAKAFNQLYDLKLTTRGIMEAAYQGELMTPSRCGRLDQACAFGSRLVSMSYDAELVQVEPLPVAKPLHLVIVDLQASKDTVVILSSLQQCFPTAKSEDEANVQRLLGPINQDICTRAEAAIASGDVAGLGALMSEAQAAFDAYAGKVCPSQLTAPVLHKVLAHEALKPHIYGGKGVGAGGDGTAQFLVRSEADQAAVAAIIRRDFGMPAFTLTIASSAPVRTAVVTAAGFGRHMFPATKACRAELFPIVGADGVAKPAIVHTLQQLVAGGIERVIIVVQPRDLAVFRDLLTERVAPAQYHRLPTAGRKLADELQELGRHVSFAVQERQEGLAHALLAARPLVGEEPFLLALGDHLFMQEDGPAAGEAGAEAAAAVGGAGDAAAPGASCVAQMLREYQRMGGSGCLVGLQRSSLDDVSSYGTFTGTWMDSATSAPSSSGAGGKAEEGRAAACAPVAAGRLLSISEVAEKPAAEYAREHLRLPSSAVASSASPRGESGAAAGAVTTAAAPVAGAGAAAAAHRVPAPATAPASVSVSGSDARWATAFGLYVLPPAVFGAVDEMVAHNLRGASGDFELTTALEQLRRSGGLTGLVVAGRRFDIGSPEHYVRAVAAFAAQKPAGAAASK